VLLHTTDLLHVSAVQQGSFLLYCDLRFSGWWLWRTLS